MANIHPNYLFGTLVHKVFNTLFNRCAHNARDWSQLIIFKDTVNFLEQFNDGRHQLPNFVVFAFLFKVPIRTKWEYSRISDLTTTNGYPNPQMILFCGFCSQSVFKSDVTFLPTNRLIVQLLFRLRWWWRFTRFGKIRQWRQPTDTVIKWNLSEQSLSESSENRTPWDDPHGLFT